MSDVLEVSNNFKNKVQETSNQVINHISQRISFNFGDEKIKWLQKNKTIIFSILLITIFFIIISKWCYNKYVQPVLDREYLPNKEFIKKDINNKIKIYFFYTNWCPYCKKARPEWEQFIKDAEDNKLIIKNYELDFIEIDAEKDTNLAKEFKIDAYPTIKIEKNGKIYNYDAKPDSKHLMEFLNGTL